MKKLFCFLLTLLTVASLAFPVLAEEEKSVAVGIYVTELTLPVAGETIPSDPMNQAKIKVLANIEGEDQPQEISVTASGSWSETDTPDKALKSGVFVTGRSYRVTVTLEFMDAAPEVRDGETEFLINKEKAKHLSNEGEKILFCADFIATPGDFVPKVSLSTTGAKTKAYDGKGTTVKADVEKIEGIEYRYVWYRNDKVMEGETAESITLKNVADSGEYYCMVIASAPSDKEAGEKSTKSSTVEIAITPCVVTVDIQDAEKNLFDPDPEFTYEILGDPYDQMTGTLSRKEGEDVGKYTIDVGTLAFPQDVAKNYSVHVNKGTLTILDVGELPFINVANVADQSYITGKSNSKIRVSAPKGALPEGAVLSLMLSEADIKEALEKEYSAKLMKSFTVKLQSADGKDLTLPKRATLRLQIPLSEEEEVFRPETILCALYNDGAKKLDSEIAQNGEVTFISLEIDALGTVALFEGEIDPTVGATEQTEKPKNEEKEKDGALWMWILIAVLSLAAIGAMVFTVIQTKKTEGLRTKTYVPPKKAPLTPEQLQEKERARRIAEELNALPPVPEAKSPNENATKTRSIPSTDVDKVAMITRPVGSMEPKKPTTPVTKPKEMSSQSTVPEKAPSETPKPRTISFEDLE
ncbi:MAG: hypothetical protein IJC26_07285 [Clostridia bacterium]|nr:hypothetical protein [Clostridia bacterium]